MSSSPHPTPSLLFALFCVLFFVTFNYTLNLIASTYIAGDLGASNDIASYSTSFYSIGNALSIPLGKLFFGRVKPGKAFLYLLLLSAFLSYTCALCPNYPLFILFRTLQGFAAGPFFPLILSLFSSLVPSEKKDVCTSIFLTIFTVVPVMGACWGGWIAYDYHWSWIFYGNIPFLLLLAGFLWIRLKHYEPQTKILPFDKIGYCFYAVGISCLCLFLIMGQQLDWLRSPLLVALGILGVLSIGFFILWESNDPYPILDLKLLKNFIFSFALFHLGVLFSAYFGMVILLALWLNLTVHYTPEWIGLLLGAMAIAGLFPTFLILKGASRIDSRIPLSIAVAFLAVSCFHTMHFNEEINFGRIALSRVIASFGLAFFLPPLFRLCFRTFSEVMSLRVVELFQVTRILSTGLGAALYITLWQRRQVFYHDRLGSKITASSPETQAFFSHAQEFQLQGASANAKLNELLDRQSIALALDDCFYFMGWVLISLLVLLALSYVFRIKGFIPEKQSVN